MAFMRKMKRMPVRRRAPRSHIAAESAKAHLEQRRTEPQEGRGSKHPSLTITGAGGKCIRITITIRITSSLDIPTNRSQAFLTTDSPSSQYPASPPKTPAPHSSPAKAT